MNCFAVSFVRNYIAIIYIVINTSLGEVFCNFHNSLIVLFALVVITFKCSSYFNQASRNMPWCFWYGGSETKLFVKCNGRWEAFLVFLLKKSWACLFRSGLKLIFHWKVHLLIWFTNHYLIHLQKCHYCGFETLLNNIWERIFIANLPLTDSHFFCWCSFKVKQSIIFVEQKEKL